MFDEQKDKFEKTLETLQKALDTKLQEKADKKFKDKKSEKEEAKEGSA